MQYKKALEDRNQPSNNIEKQDCSRRKLRVQTWDLALKEAENSANDEYQTRKRNSVTLYWPSAMQNLILAMIKLDARRRILQIENVSG